MRVCMCFILYTHRKVYTTYVLYYVCMCGVYGSRGGHVVLYYYDLLLFLLLFLLSLIIGAQFDECVCVCV